MTARRLAALALLCALTVALALTANEERQAAAAERAAAALARLATTPPNPPPTLSDLPVWQRQVVAIPHRVPFTVLVRQDAGLPIGIVRIARPGRDGVARLLVYRLYQGPRLVASTVVGERMEIPPQPELVLRGALEVARGSLSGPVQGHLTVLASAYWANPAWSNGMTATGVPVHLGSIAVDPSVIPLGTRLYVPGYGYGVADDTGAAIQGDRIDVYFPTESAALDWGLRTVTISILGP
jgi:3D (Asp-Asp-Asp) domain-containing protein